MNRIQLVGKFSKSKQRLLLADKGKWVDLLLPPSVSELENLADAQYVQVIGDIWSHPEKHDCCVVRVAMLDLFPGDKEQWASGRLTLSNCEWYHETSFAKPSIIAGTTDGKDRLFVTMPLVESRWSKKVGGLIAPRGSVDLEVAFFGSSRLECVSLIEDSTSADSGNSKAKAIVGCKPLQWHDSTVERAVMRRKREKIPPKLRRAVFMRDGFRCQECGAFPGEHKDVFLEVDHVVPVAKGGTNHINNLQTLCSVCNIGKGTDPAAPSCKMPGDVATKQLAVA